MGILELVAKIGDENITVQNLAHNMTHASQNKVEAKITFVTSKENGQAMMKGAAGLENDMIALILWFPKSACPVLPVQTTT